MSWDRSDERKDGRVEFALPKLDGHQMISLILVKERAQFFSRRRCAGSFAVSRDAVCESEKFRTLSKQDDGVSGLQARNVRIGGK